MSQLLLSEINNVNDALKSLQKNNARKPLLKDWHEDMLFHLTAEVQLNAGRMYWLLEHRQQSLPTLAYVVRNLLELNVWIKYCCKSETHGHRFYQDRWRDGKGFQKAIETLISSIPTVQDISAIEKALESFRNTLQRTAAEVGISSLDEDYKRVTTAADELGMKAFFVSANALLSKFAHPTAMTVLTFIKDEPLDSIFAFLFATGIGLAVAGCRTIVEYVRGIAAAA